MEEEKKSLFPELDKPIITNNNQSINNTKPIITNNNKAVITNEFKKKTNGLAITSLVLGILSVFIFWAIVYPVVIGLSGIITGIVSLAKRRDESKFAIIGIFLSVIGLLLGLVVMILYLNAEVFNYN